MRFSLFILLFACTTFNYDVTKCDCSEIKEEFDTFILEAKLRGIKINNTKLKIKLVDNINGGAIGKSNLITKTIKFDTTSIAWKKYRKKLIYHELGHYYLLRGHIKGSFIYNNVFYPKSIMTKGIVIDFENASEEIKLYFWDELFYNK